MRIGELAKGVGLTAKTIRYYEGARLLPPPPRTASRYRTYGRDAVKRLLLIKKLRLLEFPVVEIRRILPMLVDGHPPSRRGEVARLLEHKRDEAARRATDLTTLVKELDAYLRRLEKHSATSRREDRTNNMERRKHPMEKTEKRIEPMNLEECCEPFCPDACEPMATEASLQAVKIETTQAKDKVIKLTKAGAERVFNGEDDEIFTRDDLIVTLPDGTANVTGACSGTVWRVRRDEIVAIVDG